jgi:hypothetical protein
MNVWPLFLDLTVEPADAKRVHLWLPLCSRSSGLC